MILFFKPYASKGLIKKFSQRLSYSFNSFKQTKSNMFWFAITSQKNYEQNKHIVKILVQSTHL